MKTDSGFVKFLIWAACVVVFCGSVELYRHQRPQVEEERVEVARPIRTMALEQSQDGESRRYFGTVKGVQMVELSFRVAGQLRSLMDRGERVAKGGLISQLDPRDYEVRLRDARSRVSQNQAELEKAQNDFQRYSGLYENAAVSEMVYDSYKRAYDVARANLQASQASLREAQNALEDTKLTAPFDGVVAERFVENHQEVQAKQPIVSLQNLANLEIVFNVPESDMARIMAEGRQFPAVKVSVEALPDRLFDGTLKEYALQADAATQTYAVTVTVPQDGANTILAGMAATAFLEVPLEDQAEAKRGFRVPVSAILQDGGGSWVWRIQEGRTYKVPVEVLNSDGEWAQILGDLAAGDLIATAGVSFLWEGREVVSLTPNHR